MGIMDKFLGASPFVQLAEHTKKVHQCAQLIRPIAEAIIAGDDEKIDELHHEMSRTEHEADTIKDEIREQISKMLFLSVGKYELSRFLAFQDDVADCAEDFAVVCRLRKTRLPPELHEDFLAFVDQIIKVSEFLLDIAQQLSLLAETTFTGTEADRVLEAIERIGREEWEADKLQRKFAQHYYEIEDQLDPTTLRFYDKYCHTLSELANKAEKTAKYFRRIIG